MEPLEPSQDMPVTAVRRKYDYIARLYDTVELPIEYGRHRATRRRARSTSSITPTADPSRWTVMHLWAPWVRWVFGAAFDRDTERYVAAAGLEMVERRFLFGDIIRLIVVRPLPLAR